MNDQHSQVDRWRKPQGWTCSTSRSPPRGTGCSRLLTAILNHRAKGNCRLSNMTPARTEAIIGRKQPVEMVVHGHD